MTGKSIERERETNQFNWPEGRSAEKRRSSSFFFCYLTRMLAFTWKVSSADVRAAGGRENKFQKGGHAMRVEAVFPALLLPVVNQRERHDGRRVYKDTALRGGSLCLVFSSFFLSSYLKKKRSL